MNNNKFCNLRNLEELIFLKPYNFSTLTLAYLIYKEEEEENKVLSNPGTDTLAIEKSSKAM